MADRTRIKHGTLKPRVFELADGTRTVAEIAEIIGTSYGSVNGVVQLLKLHDKVRRGIRRQPTTLTLALSLLARAVDAMSRTEPNGVSTAEWDAIVIEGTQLLQKAVGK